MRARMSFLSLRNGSPEKKFAVFNVIKTFTIVRLLTRELVCTLKGLEIINKITRKYLRIRAPRSGYSGQTILQPITL